MGVVVDWWAQVNSLGVNSEQIVEKELKVDGIHYTSRPSISFLNLWLNTVFDADPTLLLHATSFENGARMKTKV
jgi:hypothetical protein